MKQSDVIKFLKGSLSAEELRQILQIEVSNYAKALQKKGSSAEIRLTEDETYTFNNKDLKVLCNAFLKNELNEIELGYIVDAITMSDTIDFENEEIFDLTTWLTDAEVNGEVNQVVITEILLKLV